MPLTISLRKAADAFGVRPPAAAQRLKGLPVFKVARQTRGAAEHFYPLAAVLTRARPGAFDGLFAKATDDQSLYVGSGPEVMDTARALDAWLTPSMRERYARVRTLLLAGLSAARGGEAFLPFVETLNQKVLLHSSVLRHVVLDEPNQLSFKDFAPAFALVNSTAELELEVAA
jgi:hypothetical protein